MTIVNYEKLALRYLRDGVVSIGLFGSHVRGDNGPYSDIDLVRFWEAGAAAPEAHTHLVDGHFIVVSNVLPAQVESWFSSPLEATATIKGLTFASPLLDPTGYLAELIERARSFVWDDPMQQQADALASSMMVGWIEEVQKSLEGLRRGDIGRLLNGKHGLTWGMTTVMRVHHGVLLSGDNGSFPEVRAAVGETSRWSSLCGQAFGVTGTVSLQEEVLAGLELYALTAALLRDVLLPEDKVLIDEVVNRITTATNYEH